MKKRTIMNLALILFSVLLLTGTSFAQEFEYEKERELAKAAFTCLQNADLETFSSYCTTEERFSNMLSVLDDKNPKEKGMKSELSQMGVGDFRGEAISGFKKALEQAKINNINLKEWKFPELANYRAKFDMTNLKALKVKFKIKSYLILINMFKTSDDIFIYDFSVINGGVI
ncbi:MAG: hypothetical protein JEY94_08545 [Melioribacteraceae bacterium]|nr:hypothetical protein [Melioribacteraceae bacterium]